MKLVDRVREFLDEKCQMLSTGFHADTLTSIEEWEESERFIESPVEQLFYIEWKFRQFCDPEYENLHLEPQYKDESTGKYRLDFTVAFIQEAYIESRGIKDDDIIISVEPPKLGIEIDSHMWHEKTKEQAQYHKERERFLIANNWKLLRFTGSEVYKNPEICIIETLKVADQLREKYLNKIRQKLRKRINNEKKKRG